jgi:Pentapeptide repeats (8 copies)
MADPSHLAILQQRVKAWNSWRERNPSIEPNLSEANLSGADLSEADLSGADLTYSNLVKTNLKGTTLTGCRIYGISAWGTILEGAKQWNRNVSDVDEPAVMVDNLEVAQFVYLLLNHKKLRNVLNAITKRGVLILGRFGGGGLDVLEAIAKKLRELKYQPFIFNFERPVDRNYTETVKRSSDFHGSSSSNSVVPRCHRNCTLRYRTSRYPSYLSSRKAQGNTPWSLTSWSILGFSILRSSS